MMRLSHSKIALLISLVTLVGVPTASATPFTDPALFSAAVSLLPASSTTLDFESVAVGTTIPSSGGSLGDITFASSTLDLIVSTGFSTTSGDGYLGLDDGGDEVFMPPDDLWGMTFASPLRALGLYFISSDELFAGDIVLTTPIGTAENGTAPQTLADGGLAYFIGIVSETTPFSVADVTYGPAVTDTFFLYNVDDITTVTDAAAPIPEPSTILLTSPVLAVMWMRRRSTRRSERRSRPCAM
jgi:hypothetical protein